MGQIEAQLKRMKGKSYKVGPPDKAGQQYRQWVEEFYKDSVAGGDRYLVTYAEHLREYHVALTLNTNTRMKNARKYLEKYFLSLDKEKFTDIDEKLEQLFYKAMQALDRYIQQNGEPENPQLTKLKELLLQHYKDSDKLKNGKENERSDEGDENEDSTSDHSPGNTDNKKSTIGDSTDAAKRNSEDLQSGSPGGNPEKEDHPEDAQNNSTLGEIKQEEVGKEGEKVDIEEEVQVVKTVHNGVGTEEADKTENKDSEGMDDHKESIASRPSDTTPQDKTSAHPAEWEGPKGILFTRTRESTEALMDWIKETKELDAVLRPELLVGSGDGNSK